MGLGSQTEIVTPLWTYGVSHHVLGASGLCLTVVRDKLRLVFLELDCEECYSIHFGFGNDSVRFMSGWLVTPLPPPNPHSHAICFCLLLTFTSSFLRACPTILKPLEYVIISQSHWLTVDDSFGRCTLIP